MLAVLALVGCGAPDPAAESTCGEPLRAGPGELRTVIRGDWLGPEASLGSAAVLPDGSVLVGYDTNPYVPGDDEGNAEEREPGLVVLRPDGWCRPFELPVVDGVRVGEDARPEAVDGAGRLYLYDRSGHRVVRGSVRGTWETVTTIPTDVDGRTGVSAVAIGADDEVYVLTGFRVSTVAADGTLVPIAGNGEDFVEAEGTMRLPRPATSAPLPLVREAVVLQTGQLVLPTGSTLLVLEDGRLDVLADAASTAGQEGSFDRNHWLTGLAPLPSGDVLVGDPYGNRILRISGGRSSVFLTDDSSLSIASPAPMDLGAGTGLLVWTDGGEALSVYGLPD